MIDFKSPLTLNDIEILDLSTTHFTPGSIECLNNNVKVFSIMKKPTGSITLLSFDADQEITEIISPFESFYLIIEGSADVIINGVSCLLKTGMCIIKPAHTLYSIIPHGRVKMLSAIIKRGY